MSTHGFQLIQETEIEELKTQARLYRHVKSGAELLSLHNDDENKVFGITFRTPPPDSTGVAHIMEHAVLCGSRKYPIKDPFAELIKGSLNTFLNAFTYPDKTCYPVASTNIQDFYNLIDVYLDAVFYPRITPEILEQEGWHYEVESVEEPIAFKGVVYNEMKGAYSSPDGLLMREAERSLFAAGHPYAEDSGGDPQRIPDLTYEAFKRFHDLYYHPSNARIFFAGDDDGEERLRLLDAYLQDFDAIQPPSQIPLHPLQNEPLRLVRNYAASDDGDALRKSFLTVNWLLPEIIDETEIFLLSILSYALVGTQASPLRKALIDSGLGEDVVSGGFDFTLRQGIFNTGLKGVDPDNLEQAEALIHQTLEKLAAQGVESELVEAAINTLEFNLRENNTGSFPRGIALMLRSLSTWLYDRDPVTALAFEKPLAEAKSTLAQNPAILQELLRRYVVENNHRTVVILMPDPEQQQRDDAVEEARLAAAQSQMDAADLAQLVERTHRLQEMQITPDPPEALAAIPSLSLSDLDPQGKSIPMALERRQGAQIAYHDLFTNGIAYVNVGFDMHTLPQELLPYTGLFGRALLDIGTEKEDFVKLSQRIGRKTGGVWNGMFNADLPNQTESTAWLFLSGKSTMEQSDDLLAIMQDILLTVKLDNQERFRQMVLRSKSGRESSLIPRGHGVVSTRLQARFTEAGWMDEELGGITNLFFLRNLINEVEQDWPSVLAKLEQIRSILFNRNALIANVTLDEANWNTLSPKLDSFLSALPAGPVTHQTWQPRSYPQHEGLTIPTQVNYVGKGGNLYDLGYVYDGSVAVITKYLYTAWLWERVRVQGGAYGAFANFSRLSGIFGQLSYRDPNLMSTLDIYDQTATFLRNLDLSQDELTKSIVGAIGMIDDYQLPDAKGYTAMTRHLLGDTEEMRQVRREQILTTTAQDFRDFGQVLAELNEVGNVVVLGSADAIQTANAGGEDAHGTPKNWLTIEKVL